MFRKAEKTLNARVVLCTFPNLEQARQIGTVLVEKQLAACVNLVPGVRSIYRWQGGIEEAGEILALFKTTCETYEAFAQTLRELHPYDVPEIVAVEPAEVEARYLGWLVNNVAVPDR